MESLEQRIAKIVREHKNSLDDKIAKVTEAFLKEQEEEKFKNIFRNIFKNVTINFYNQEVEIGGKYYDNFPKISDIVNLISNFEIVDYVKIKRGCFTTMTPTNGNYYEYSKESNAVIDNVGQFILRSEGEKSVFLNFGLNINQVVFNIKCLLGRPFRLNYKRNDYMGGFSIFGETIDFPEIKVLNMKNTCYRFDKFKYSGSDNYPKTCVYYPQEYSSYVWDFEKQIYVNVPIPKITLLQFLSNFL